MAMSTDRTNAVVRDYTSRTVVAAVFADRSQAERAIDALRAAGFTGKQVGVAMRDRSEAGELIKDTGASAVEGAVSGAVGGGLLGGVAGFLVGLVSALVIPGIGPGIGAAAGGLVGALTGLGFPEEEARYFDTSFRSGAVLVTVHTEGRSPEAVNILQRYGGDLGAGALAK